MHDPVEELTESECLSLLRTVGVGRVAMIVGDHDVEVFPVNFVVDHGTILFRTAPGTKLATITERPRVTFEADWVAPGHGASWSVIAKGDAREVTGRDDLMDLFDVDLISAHPAPKPSFIRITPRQFSGRRFPVPAGPR